MPGKFQPSDNGPAIHRWLLGDALLEAKEHLNDPDEFGVRIEFAMSVVPHLFGADEASFEAEFRKLLVDDHGQPIQPGQVIPKRTRLRMMRETVRRAVQNGMLDFKKKPMDDARKLFAATTGDDEEPEDPEELE